MQKKRQKEDSDDIEPTGDDNLEETELEVIEENSVVKVTELKKKLAASEEERRKLMEDLQRAKADFLNARKRLEDDRTNDKIRVAAAHVMELLPLCDSLEAALAPEVLNDIPENLQKGLRGVYSQLLGVIKGYGVMSVGEAGETFDPAIHEAVANVKVEDNSSDHKVIVVVQKGYKMKDTLLRPARVTVGVLDT